ncbi:MAG: YqjK family protein [Betaproteobacteria bacterium]|nr:YqjK family protein [Betaproteobacteria bacterium]
MNKKLIHLAQRRKHLLTQVAAQRIVLAQNVEPLRAPLLLVDRGVTTLRYLKRHPTIFVTAGLMLATFRLKYSGKWVQRAWIGWQLGRRLFKK